MLYLLLQDKQRKVIKNKMSHNPKLSVYIVTLKPKKEQNFKTYRDFLWEKYHADSSTTDAELLQNLLQSFVEGVGQDKFYKDDKSKKVIGVDDGGILPLTLDSQQWFFDGVIEGGKYGLLREFADTEKKREKQVIPASNAVLDKYYILLNPILNDSYAILLVQSYTEESVQASVTALMRELFGGNDNFYKVQIEPFVPKRFKDKYKASAAVRMFSFTTPIYLSDSLRDSVPEANQIFEVEIRIKPKKQGMPIFSPGTVKVIDACSKKMFDNQSLEESRRKVFMTDELGRNANYDISKDIQSIRPTIYLSDEGISSDTASGIPNFADIRKYCRRLLQEVRKEIDLNQDIDEF